MYECMSPCCSFYNWWQTTLILLYKYHESLHGTYVFFFGKVAPIQCQKCPLVFLTRNDPLIHVREYHKSLPRLKCLVCGKAFPYNSFLDAHMKSHLRDDICTYTESDCGYKCTLKMEHHVNIHSIVCEEYQYRRCDAKSYLHIESHDRHEASCS